MLLLTPRLDAVARSVGYCKAVCDIGTDHAYVPIHLLRNELCEYAYVTDINKGPLIIARKNLKRFGLIDRATLIQGNGLEPLRDITADVAVVAGMGGMLITQMLQRSCQTAYGFDRLILQPMNSHEVLREYLNKNGFVVCDERLAMEGHKLYLVITAKKGVDIARNIFWYYAGDILKQKKDELYPVYLTRLKNGFVKRYDGLSKSLNPDRDELDRLKFLISECDRFNCKL